MATPLNFCRACVMRYLYSAKCTWIIKVVIWNILPASTRNELKFFLKIAFMFLAIILKWQVPNGDIFLVIGKKKVTVLAGPWSAGHVNNTETIRKSSRE